MTKQPEPTITITVDAVETALSRYLRRLDYDLHKSIERGEEDGLDHYPEEAAELFKELRVAGTAEQELLGRVLRAVAEYAYHAGRQGVDVSDLLQRVTRAGFTVPSLAP